MNKARSQAAAARNRTLQVPLFCTHHSHACRSGSYNPVPCSQAYGATDPHADHHLFGLQSGTEPAIAQLLSRQSGHKTRIPKICIASYACMQVIEPPKKVAQTRTVPSMARGQKISFGNKVSLHLLSKANCIRRCMQLCCARPSTAEPRTL